MRIYGHDFNWPYRWAVVEDSEPLPEIGDPGLLRDFDGTLQCPVSVASIERNHNDTCWIVQFDVTGPFSYSTDADWVDA